jgi:hypothetical protein
MDVAQWTHDMATCTQTRFPGVDIRVAQAAGSLSGFSVVLRLAPSSSSPLECWGLGRSTAENYEEDDHQQNDTDKVTLPGSTRGWGARRKRRLRAKLNAFLGALSAGCATHLGGLLVSLCIVVATVLFVRWMGEGTHTFLWRGGVQIEL